MKFNLKKDEKKEIKKIILSYNLKDIFLVIILISLPLIAYLLFFSKKILSYFFIREITILFFISSFFILNKNSNVALEKNKLLKQIILRNNESMFYLKKSFIIYNEDKPKLLAIKIDDNRYDLRFSLKDFKSKERIVIKILPKIAYDAKIITNKFFISKENIIEIANFLELNIRFVE